MDRIYNQFWNRKQFMKNFLFLLSFNLLSINIWGQTENQLRKYFEENISSLDPIEGIYDVELVGIPRNPVRIFDEDILKEHYNVYIYKYDDMFVQFEPKVGTTGKYVRIGESNAYTYTHSKNGYKLSDRIYLDNNSNFELQYNHPIEDKEYSKLFLKKGNYIVYEETYLKTYPTPSMCMQKKKYEEESQLSQWTGTGFALSGNYIVTNYHVISEADNITIQGVNGNINTKYNAEVVATDKRNDLAILKLLETSISSIDIPYNIKTKTSEVGEEVFVLGYPLTSTMGDEIKLTTGVISSKTGYQGDISLYQISAPIQPGNSGGPLFDSMGNIIGIVSAKHKGAENVGYAIKTSYLQNLIESSVSKNLFPLNNRIKDFSLSNKVKAVKNFVYYITCSKKIQVEAPNHEESATIKNDTKRISGFRIQVYKGGNSNKDREIAEKIGKELKYLFPNEPVYVHFYDPNWICRIGDYVSYEEAVYMKNKIDKIGFPKTQIMKGLIKIRQ